MCYMATPDTQLFGISTSKTTEKSLYNLKKKNKLQHWELWVCLNALFCLIEKTVSFVATVNVYLDTTK